MNNLNESPVFFGEGEPQPFCCESFTEDDQLLQEVGTDQESDIKDEEAINRGTGNRIMEFYLSSTQCEFQDCKSLAKFHCIDGDSYKGGCGRLYCADHASAAEVSGKSDEELCLLCSDCEDKFRQQALVWKMYCLVSLLSIIVCMFFIWKILVTVLLTPEM